MPYEFDAYGIREEGIILASVGRRKEGEAVGEGDRVASSGRERER